MRSIGSQAAHTLAFRALTFACRAGLVFILARLLTPEEYGAYSLVTAMSTFGIILGGLNLSTFVYRSVPGRPQDEQLRVFKTGLLFELALASALAVLVLLSGAVPRLLVFVQSTRFSDAFTIGIALIILLIAVTESLQLLVGQARIERSNWVDFLSQASWVPPLAVFAVAGGHVSINGVLMAQAAGCVAALLYVARQIDLRAWWQVRPNWELLRSGLAYSVPMMVSPLSFYSLKLSDRFILSHYHTLQEAALYSFAYTLVNTVYTFTAWVAFTIVGPRIIAAHTQGDLEQRDWLQTYTVKISVTSFVVVAAAMFLAANTLIRFVARPEYLAARQVLPIVSVAYVFLILTFPAQYALMMQKRMAHMVAADVAGMAVGIIGNLLLIPRWSYVGAAVASALGFGVVMVGKYASSDALKSLRLDALFSLDQEWKIVRRYYGYVRSGVA